MGRSPLRSGSFAVPAEPVCFTVEARGPLILDPPITLCDFVAASLRSGEARMDTSLNVAMASSVTPAEYKALRFADQVLSVPVRLDGVAWAHLPVALALG